MNGPWVAGVLVNNVWSLGGNDGLFATRYNNFLTQPFVNYNFGERLVRHQLPDRHRELGDAGDQMDASDRRRRRTRGQGSASCR